MLCIQVVKKGVIIMMLKCKAALAAVLFVCAGTSALAAPVDFDFTLEILSGSGPSGSTGTPPFSGSLTVDDSEFGSTMVSPTTFSFDFFDRTINPAAYSSASGDLFVDLTAGGDIAGFIVNYDSANDLSFDTDERISPFFFRFDYNGGGGSGNFVIGTPTPPSTPQVPLPATAPLLLGALLGAGFIARRKR